MPLATLPSWPNNTWPLNNANNYAKEPYVHSPTNAYGNYAVYYTVTTNRAQGTLPSLADWQNIISIAKQEYTRRGRGTSTLSISGPVINADDYNNIISLFQVTDSRADASYNGTYVDNGTLTATPFGPTAPASLTTLVSLSPFIIANAPSSVNSSTIITAADINALCYSLYNTGARCTCNCNYCTCNCNYCTCNCNYSCTCDCNYH